MLQKNIEAVYGLSPGQLGMLIDTMNGATGDGTYVVQMDCALRGDLHTVAFHKAWQHLIDRHSILRTAFASDKLRDPVQVVGRNVRLPFHEIDWRTRAAEVQAADWAAVCRSDRADGFRLSRAPLMRVTLARFEDSSYRLLWTFHHILLDGWSVSIVLRELLACYEAYARGGEPPLPAPVPFADYINWLHRQDLSRCQAFWQSQLSGFEGGSTAGITLDVRRVAHRSSGFGRAPAQLDEADTDLLYGSAREHNLTVGTFLQAAWSLVLSRYAGKNDVTFGVTLSGRPPQLRNVESIVGSFINTLPMRVRVRGERTVLQWLTGIQAQVVAMQQTSHVSALDIQKWSGSSNGARLFESIVVYENFPKEVTQIAAETSLGLGIDDIRASGRTNYPLTLVGAPGRRLGLQCEYDPERYSEQEAERIVLHLKQALRGLVYGLTGLVRDVSILGEEEQRSLTLEWNQGGSKCHENRSPIEIWEAEAAAHPEAVAAVCGADRITYSQLEERANRLAQRLCGAGTTTESRVAILLDRGIDLVIGILAAWKAGAAYVPIDPAYPDSRKEFMVRDAGVGLAITDRAGASSAALAEIRTILLDEDTDAGSARLLPRVLPDNLAYVMYTSGSTGRPKGVQITHRNVTRLIASTQERFAFGRGDTWSMCHSPAFDFSVWEMWGCLLTGGRLAIAPTKVSRSPERMLEFLERERVTILNITPSALRRLLDTGLHRLPHLWLRTVIFGGEALNVDSVRRWWTKYGEAPQMVNMYGITETTVHTTWRYLQWNDTEAGRPSAIGCGLPDVRIYLLDSAMRPVAIGVSGELYVGGEGLARGYWKRPELTAERFVPDPFGPPGARLYRSGDVARYLATGDLVYVGRSDDQVKIRGFRIETGEVETALRSYPGIADVVVLPSTDERGDNRLVAYFTGENFPSVGDWWRHLRERLPDYMIPSAFVHLARFPLTENGKLDKKALPRPGTDRPELGIGYTEPATAIELAIAEIWEKVLGVRRPGVHDNFFALGGDSMRIVQVRSMAQENGIAIAAEQMFRLQTIRELAAAVETGGAVPQRNWTGPFELIAESDRRKLPSDVEAAYPLLPLQAGMLFHGNFSPHSTMYHDLFSYHLETAFDGRRFIAAAESLIRRHEVLRTSLHVSGFSEPLQLVHSTVPCPVSFLDLRGIPTRFHETAIRSWLEREKHNQFDSGCAPLLRLIIHRRTNGTFQFTISFHHAIMDGWSLATVLTELFQHYLQGAERERLMQGAPEPFRNFVAAHLRLASAEESRRFWTEYLQGSTATTLPARSHQHAPRAFRIKRIALPAGISDGLKRLTQVLRAPLKSVLLAVHLKVLSFISGQTDILTGVVTHGRDKAGDAATVGLFLNTVPFRQRVGGGSWAELVEATISAESAMRPHAMFPLAEIQNATGGQQLFEAAFNFIHFHVLQAVSSFENINALGEIGYDETNFTLLTNFAVNALSGEIGIRLDYDAAKISEADLECIERGYLESLTAICADPSQRHDALCLMSPEQLQNVLVDWNGPRQEYPPGNSVTDLFEEQAEKTPNAAAIVFHDRKLTYRQLDRLAAAVAKRLRAAGAGPESRVGICLERTPAMCIAVLGVLKSGAAYVPLNPGDPPERLRTTLSEAAAGLAITEPATRDRLSGDGCLFLNIDDLMAEKQDEAISQCPAKLQNLAYVIYTSGSTGKPKGIGLSHGALRNLLYWYRGRLRPNARVLQFASLTFDVSFLEMFSTWMTGGSLYICPQEARRDARVLVRMLCNDCIERAILPVVVLQQVADIYRPGVDNLTSLRELITTGDQLRITSSAVQFFHALGQCRLENHYGPSEAHVVSSYRLPEDPGTWPTHPPIGRPISNLDMYVLDEAMLPVPVGTPGDLYLAGAGLARGYLERPDLTAERFLPDPYTGMRGGRLYKTGDVARFRDDGNIEFLGRLDHQVKIRGYRVELGEIEAALNRHPGIRKAVVAAPGNNGTSRQLVAWLIPEGAKLAVQKLRAYLADLLPEYMIPAEWVWVDALPLTSNGKLDYSRLPTPERSQADRAEFVAPSNAIEDLVASIFQDVLHIDRVGTTDNFLDLGGNSLLAMQAMVRVRDILHVEVPLSSFFDAPTVSGIVDAASTIGDRIVLEEVARATLEVARLSSSQLMETLLHERAAQQAFHAQAASMPVSA